MRFVIYAPPYNEKNGGSIVLHRLCHFLNSIGCEAYIYSSKNPTSKNKSFIQMFKFFKYHVKKNFVSQINSNFATPLINIVDKANDIVVYAEIVDGNPLGAQKVVRWFLHKPGFHSGKINYGKNELYFYYREAFNDTSINKEGADNRLRVIYLFGDIYKQTNNGKRIGTCYALRKGSHKKLIHDISNSILIDHLPHKKIAEIFNQVEVFISYDTQTVYSWYAVMCGCKSVVVPDDGVSIEEWQPEPYFRNGIAYGFDDMERAEGTRQLLIDTIKKEEQESINDVNKFVEKCHGFFNLSR